MNKFWKVFSILFFLCGIGFASIVCLGFYLLVTTLDSKEYRSTDVFDYYTLTPGLFKKFPRISENIIYISKADDNYGYSKDTIVWNDVNDVPAAEKILQKYFNDNGFTERKDGIVWNLYWSDAKPGICPSEQYTIVWGYHSINVVLITGAPTC